MNEPANTIEAARKIKSILRKAFSKVDFTVKGRSYSYVEVDWADDDGPSSDAAKAVLLASKLAAINERDELVVGKKWRVHFYAYNKAKREADQLHRERLLQEDAVRRTREDAAIAEARRNKDAALAKVDQHPLPRVSDFAVFAAFEQLRERAETVVALDPNRTRRPSWAPPLVLDDELAEVCIKLGYLAADDKAIGRLWTHYATPQRAGRYARDHFSTHRLEGIACRGFQLFAGGERGTMSMLLFEAQREKDGAWRFGPIEYPSSWQPYWNRKRERRWAELIRERENLNHAGGAHDRIARIGQEIAAIDRADAADAQKHHDDTLLRQRALELARARVLDFVGAPGAQMQAAARLWGHCCCCGKGLTDPISLERGIGPDCWQAIVNHPEFATYIDARVLEQI
jgi:hypothetical protein